MKFRIERKYILNIAQYIHLREIVEKTIPLDPHCFSQNYYEVFSMYYDTPGFTFYKMTREGEAKHQKIRVRGYGDISNPSRCWLEFKGKYNQFQIKERGELVGGSVSEFFKNPSLFLAANSPEILVDFFQKNNLNPVLLIGYKRTAFENHLVVPGIRINFDFDFWAELNSFPKKARPPLGENILMEIKSDSFSLPAFWSNLIDWVQAREISFSKYNSLLEFCKRGVER